MKDEELKKEAEAKEAEAKEAQANEAGQEEAAADNGQAACDSTEDAGCQEEGTPEEFSGDAPEGASAKEEKKSFFFLGRSARWRNLRISAAKRKSPPCTRWGPGISSNVCFP